MVGLITKPIVANRRAKAEGLANIPASLGETIGAVAGDGLDKNPMALIERWRSRSEREEADDGYNLMSEEDANNQFGIPGHLKFDGPTDATTGRELFHLKRDEIRREEVLARGGQGLGTAAAHLAAGFVVSAIDPINIASAFVPVIGPARYGIALARRSGNLARAGLRARVGAVEGLAGAALVEPIVYGLTQQEQADYGAVDSLLNLTFGTILGGGLHAGGGAALDKIRTMRSGRDVDVRRDEIAAGVAELVEDGEVNRAGGAEVRATARAQPTENSPPIEDRSGDEDMTRPDNLDGIIYEFNPAEIEADAATFQFEAGGDSAGVTDRLAGVTQWDAAKSGTILVYERADGQRFIADGHQRLGLARRIQEADPSQDIKLYGYLYKAIDGRSPESVRMTAAMVNIAQGTGTAIDAAKVLRVDPAMINDPSMPRRSELIGQAKDLVALSDEAFLLVVNEVVPANMAALVGRLAPKDEQLQGALLRLLASEDPASVIEAEAIVRQGIAAGVKVEVQTGLFGEETVADSLFGPRAKVLARAIKLLKSDKQVFKTLSDNIERIQDAGKNRLDTVANKDKSDASSQALEILQILANRAGAVSDSLNAGARAVAGGGDIRGAARAVADSVTAESGNGNLAAIIENAAAAAADARAAAASDGGGELDSRAGRQADAQNENGSIAGAAAEPPGDSAGTGQLDPGTPIEEIVNPIDASLAPEQKSPPSRP